MFYVHSSFLHLGNAVKPKVQCAEVSRDKSSGRRDSRRPEEGEDEETDGLMDTERLDDESHIETLPPSSPSVGDEEERS